MIITEDSSFSKTYGLENDSSYSSSPAADTPFACLEPAASPPFFHFRKFFRIPIPSFPCVPNITLFRQLQRKGLPGAGHTLNEWLPSSNHMSHTWHVFCFWNTRTVNCNEGKHGLPSGSNVKQKCLTVTFEHARNHLIWSLMRNRHFFTSFQYGRLRSET